MSNPWYSEFRRAFIGLLLALVVGVLLGNIMAVLLLAVATYCGWHIYCLYQLLHRIHEGKLHKLPDAGGVWGEVYYHICRLQKRNRDGKKRLANMLTRFKESTAAMPDGAVVLTEQWEIEWYNKAAKKLLGLKSRDDIGQRIDNLIRDPRFVQYTVKGDFAKPLELVAPIDPQIQILLRIIPYARKQQLMVIRDVTHIHRLEQMRRNFVANVSHELRTPLTVIKGYLEAMVDSGDDSLASWQGSIAQMSQQAQRMNNIVEDLLLLSSLDNDDQAPVEKPVVVHEILSAIKADAIALSGEQQHDIQLEADKKLLIKGSGKELQSAFANLVFNAVQYSPDKGEIKMRWYRDDRGAHFEVSDNGPGIAPQHISRLTERFYRVDAGRSRDSGGTGLGLAIVKHVLMRHDASLRIDSQIGRGSQFVCDFPEVRIIVGD